MDVGGSYGAQKDWTLSKCIPNIMQSEKNDITAVHFKSSFNADNLILTLKKWKQDFGLNYACMLYLNARRCQWNTIESHWSGFWSFFRDFFVLAKIDFRGYVTFWWLTSEISSSFQIISVLLSLPLFSFTQWKDTCVSYSNRVYPTMYVAMVPPWCPVPHLSDRSVTPQRIHCSNGTQHCKYRCWNWQGVLFCLRPVPPPPHQWLWCPLPLPWPWLIVPKWTIGYPHTSIL